MAEAKKGDTVVTVGTRKGLFILHSKDRKRWQKRGPYFEGVEIRHAILDPTEGKTLYAGVTSEHWGPMVARSTNLGGRWDLGKEGPRFTKESGLTVTRIWQVQQGVDGALYAGTEPAGLFRSENGGVTWASVDSLNYYKGRDKWPPGGGGLCLHTILPYPKDVRRMLIGISAAGIFATNNGGGLWRELGGGGPGDGPAKIFDPRAHGPRRPQIGRDPPGP